MLTTDAAPAKADPEVSAIARRRQFTAEYKRRLLREYEVSPKGERGAILRREGLYSSHIDAWRKQQGADELAALTPKKRGRKPTVRRDEVTIENKRLLRQVARLEHQLARAQKVIEVQKKISEILGIDQTLPDELKDDES